MHVAAGGLGQQVPHRHAALGQLQNLFTLQLLLGPRLPQRQADPRQRLGAAAQLGRRVDDRQHLLACRLQAKGRQLRIGVGQALHIKRRVLGQLLDHAHGLSGLFGTAQDARQAPLELLEGAAGFQHLFSHAFQLVQADQCARPRHRLVSGRADLLARTFRTVTQLAHSASSAFGIGLHALHLAAQTFDAALQLGRQARRVFRQQLLTLQATHGGLQLLDLGRDLGHAAHAQLLEGGLQRRPQRAGFGTHGVHHVHVVGGLALRLHQLGAQLGLLIA